LSGITVLLYALLSGTLPVVPVVSTQVLITAPLLFLIGGLVNGEEIGWRGFALPQLLAKHSALTASLILGSLWATVSPAVVLHPRRFVCQHAAAVLPGAHDRRGNPVTWIYNNTGGSLLLAYLMHAASNFWPRALPMEAIVGPFAWLPDAITILAIVLVVRIYGRPTCRVKP